MGTENEGLAASWLIVAAVAQFLSCSVTELAESGCDGALGVRGMLEGYIVPGAPGELSAEARVDTLFVVALRRHVSNFDLGRLKGVHAWVELRPLHHGHGGNVADVAHRLELIQVLPVVHEVEHEVVLHGDVESLHLLRLSAASLADSAIDGVLGLHERLVLGLDLVNDAWRVDGVAMAIPINVFKFCTGLILVVVVEESLQLAMGVTGALIRSRCSKSLKPDSSQVAA